MLVRSSGRFPGARSGSGDRSWLLIKHRDDWSGDLDITEFAPKSVKSDGHFEDILGGEAPAIWTSNRPAKGGDTGAMFEEIIEKAAKLKAERVESTPSRARSNRKSHEGTKARRSRRKKPKRAS